MKAQNGIAKSFLGFLEIFGPYFGYPVYIYIYIFFLTMKHSYKLCCIIVEGFQAVNPVNRRSIPAPTVNGGDQQESHAAADPAQLISNIKEVSDLV